MSDDNQDNAEQLDEERRARLDRLIQDNELRIAALAQKGIGVDQNSLDRVRLAYLCDMLIGTPGSPARVLFELGLQKIFSDKFDETESQVRRSTLTQGIVLPGPGGSNGHHGNPRRAR